MPLRNQRGPESSDQARSQTKPIGGAKFYGAIVSGNVLK